MNSTSHLSKLRMLNSVILHYKTYNKPFPWVAEIDLDQYKIRQSVYKFSLNKSV